LMAGLGIDAAVLSRLSKKWKGRIGMLAYLPAIGRALPTTRPFTAILDLDGVARQAEALQIVVGNTRRYASVTSVTPTAMVDDGRLDVCVLSPGNPLSAVQQLSTLVLRNRPNQVSAVNDRVGHLTVRTTELIPLQADGGQIKQKKIAIGDEGVVYEFTVRAQELTVLIPRDYNGEIFQSGVVAESTRQSRVAERGNQGKSWYRVVSVGIDTLSVARARDGKVATVKITPRTRASSNGHEATMSTFLASLGEGRLIQVKGKTSKKQRAIVARKLRA
jgi:hypothetical protein